MRKYLLASVSEREDVNLRDYENTIKEAVHEFMPTAQVIVENDCYYVDPTPNRGTAVKIGRKICQSQLKGSCITIRKLFASVEVEGVEQNVTKKPRNAKHAGGHH